MDDQSTLKRCLVAVEEQAALGPSDKWKQREYEELSAQILRKTNTLLSVSTLKRIWRLEVTNRPQRSTLDALTQYIGEENWYSFVQQTEEKDRTEETGPGVLQVLKDRLCCINYRILMPYLIILVMLIGFGWTFIRFTSKELHRQIPVSIYDDQVSGTPLQTIEHLYRFLSVDPGEQIPVDSLQSIFIDNALIILRAEGGVMNQHSVKGFIQSMQSFVAGEAVQANGFDNRIIGSKSYVHGDIAQVYIRFQGYIRGYTSPASNGFDTFHLIRTPEGWRITSILGESYDENTALPGDMQ